MAANESVAMQTVRTCKACGARTYAGFGELHYTAHGVSVLITDVPMSICPNCGERYVPGPVGIAISDLVAEIVRNIEATGTSTELVADGEIRLRAGKHLRELALAS